MYVAVSSRCFPDLALNNSLEKLSDLEYSAAEIVIGNQPSDLRPEWIAEDFNQALRLSLCCRAISPVCFFFDIPTDDPNYFTKFENCCLLARALKIVIVTIRSAPLGTPYNEEIERLQRLNAIASREGIVISLLTEGGCISESCDSIGSLCKSVPHLAITLDPSHFIYKREKPVDYESILPLVRHVRLRDTTAKSFQVQIGQGILEYNRLVIGLNKIRYSGALCVDLGLLPDIDQESELRKMRLLLESLL